MIKENLNEVKLQIAQACRRCGRNPDEITLIAVSKTKPLEALTAAYDCGVRSFGENKVQEILTKQPQMPVDACFHMIGHLQRNKVKQVISYVELIHSVDSVRLAEQIQKEAQKENRTVSILLEVNAAKEASKYGFLAEEVSDAVNIIKDFPNIRIQGLMTIAPFVADPNENRTYFKKLYQLSVDIEQENIDNVSMGVLSMGMTGDYEVAIEEGATMIRVGTGIFGTR
ncbi:MAG: YggS family pyridoxal phosphate-dependent enzyme [Lachnospiraceae bacterium]